jgi:hypothetical protein
LRISIAETPSPSSQITNAEAIGKATRMQGYPARLGLGMTLSKNQARDKIPIINISVFVHSEALGVVIEHFFTGVSESR